ncbi:MAG: hypothetical protein QE265_09975 [Rhodoferax sp.]|nr:hypothetical protein [Rhodoferax sp.]
MYRLTEQSIQIAALATVLCFLTGCAQLSAIWHENASTGKGAEQFSAVDKHSPYPAIRREDFEQVNLVELIDPEGNAKNGDLASAWKDTGEGNNKDMGRRFDLAFAAFRLRADSPHNPKKLQRNAVQDRILGVSTSRCNVFKTYLRRQQSDTNFLLGTATTISGVLGAMVDGATASRNLAGAAGIFSGVQAEFNSSYYSNLAAQVIVQGIENHQNRLLTQIIQERQKRSVDDYSMEAAVKDALYFDGTCSTVIGLLEAAESIKEVNNPGLPRAAEIIASVKAMNQLAQTDNIQAMAQSGELEHLLKLSAPKTSPLAVVALGNQDPNTEIMGRLQTAANAIQRFQSAVQKHAEQLRILYKQAQDNLPKDKRSEANLGILAAEAFREQSSLWLSASKLDACVQELKTAAAPYSKAVSDKKLALENSADQLQLQVPVGVEGAKAQGAASNVEWMLAILQQQVQKSADIARKALTADSPSDVATIKSMWGNFNVDATSVPNCAK